MYRPILLTHVSSEILVSRRRLFSSGSSKNYMKRQANDVFVRNAIAAGYRARSAYKLHELATKYHLIRGGDTVVDIGAAPGGWTQVAVEFCRSKFPVFETLEINDLTCNPDGSEVAADQVGPAIEVQRRPKRMNVFELLKPENSDVQLIAEKVYRPRLPESFPEGAKVIAVDLLHIDPIDGAITIRGDFTKANVKNFLLRRLSGAGPDVVISDIAHSFSGHSDLDASKQMTLSWMSFLFALECLKNRGNFVVKVRNGEEYEPFREACKSVFRRVHEVKPKASRSESAECFLVCKDILRGSEEKKFSTDTLTLNDRFASRLTLLPPSSIESVQALGLLK